METRQRWKRGLIWTGGALIAAALLLVGTDTVERHISTPEEPCFDPTHAHALPLAELTADELVEHHDDLARRAREHRRAAEMLRQDPRWEDPDQRPYLEEAINATTGMAGDYEAEADTAADILGCADEEI